MRRTLLPLLLTLAVLGSFAFASAPTASAHAARLHYQRGYSIQGGWLCYGWSNGAYHCTTHHQGFHSLNPRWVPNYGSPQAPAKHAAPARTMSAGHSPNSYPFGQCTWGAAHLAHDNVNGLGNAKDWLWRARARGLPTGSTPRIGATVVFQPGVQGASRTLGHVGHVIAIGPGGSFLMEAMNDNAGFGRYATRWVHTGWGVGFIY